MPLPPQSSYCERVFEPERRALAEAPDAIAEVHVLADQLMAARDPRGELLALELAAALADDAAESRRLTREVQRIRARNPSAAWPEALLDQPVTLRGGLPTAGPHALLEATRDPNLTAFVRRLAVEVERGQLGSTAEHLCADCPALEALVLGQPRDRGYRFDLAKLAPLRTHPTLTELRIRGSNKGAVRLADHRRLERLSITSSGNEARHVLTALAQLELRELSWLAQLGADNQPVTTLAPTLERLGVYWCDAVLDGLELPSLRELSLARDVPSVGRLPPLPGSLRSLEVFTPSDTELEEAEFAGVEVFKVMDAHNLENRTLRAFPGLRTLELLGSADALELEHATELERLVLWADVHARVDIPATVTDLSFHARSPVSFHCPPKLRLRRLCIGAHRPRLAPRHFDEVEELELDLGSLSPAELEGGLPHHYPSLRRIIGRVGKNLEHELRFLIEAAKSHEQLRELVLVGPVPSKWLQAADAELPGVACIGGPAALLGAASWPRTPR